MHLKIQYQVSAELFLRGNLVIFVLIVPSHSMFDQMKEKQDTVQGMPVKIQIRITMKNRATFTIFCHFCSQRLAMYGFKKLSE